jgi:uroporphyrinogen-III synthase
LKIKKVVNFATRATEREVSLYGVSSEVWFEDDFRPFIHVEGVFSKEFRQQKINILDHTAVIFTSKTAVDQFL